MKRLNSLLLALTTLWISALIALGFWWQYVIRNLLALLRGESASAHFSQLNIENMIVHEGTGFIVFIILISVTIFSLYLRDRKKALALQVFKSSLTHQLKRPAANIRLQVESLDSFLQGLSPSENQHLESAKTIIHKLVRETETLETQLDKIIQLSKIEQDQILKQSSAELRPFIEDTLSKWGNELNVDNTIDSNFTVLIDEFSFELVFRILIENTLTHTDSKNISISSTCDMSHVYVEYSDEGQFENLGMKLGSAMPTRNAAKGPEIGLYLVNKILHSMGGSVLFNTKNNFKIILKLQRTKG